MSDRVPEEESSSQTKVRPSTREAIMTSGAAVAGFFLPFFAIFLSLPTLEAVYGRTGLAEVAYGAFMERRLFVVASLIPLYVLLFRPRRVLFLRVTVLTLGTIWTLAVGTALPICPTCALGLH